MSKDLKGEAINQKKNKSNIEELFLERDRSKVYVIECLNLEGSGGDSY